MPITMSTTELCHINKVVASACEVHEESLLNIQDISDLDVPSHETNCFLPIDVKKPTSSTLQVYQQLNPVLDRHSVLSA